MTEVPHFRKSWIAFIAGVRAGEFDFETVIR